MQECINVGSTHVFSGTVYIFAKILLCIINHVYPGMYKYAASDYIVESLRWKSV